VRALATHLGAWLRNGLAASAAAVLATLPLTWTTFGECAPAGVVLTLLALPPFAFLSLLAWLAALLPWSGFALPAELGARALYALLELGDALPGTPLLLPPRPAPLLFAATALAFLGLAHAWARRAAALVWGSLLLPWSAAPRGLELHLLDAGHGCAAVLRAPGIDALVFDAGSRDRRALASEALLPLLARWEVARASVVLSHPDADHASGLPRLSERLRIDRWLGARPAQGPVRLPHGVPEIDLARGRLACGTPSPELSLALLRGSAAPGNEGSRALEIAWRGERLLLLGDAEEDGLEGLPLEPGRTRLLLAPHHGSDAPALGSLLGRLSPAEVWISSSGDPPICGELERHGIEWRWTGRDGPLALRLP
jgi:competence protein ComEC